MDNLNSLTISTALEALREQKISPQDLTAACLHQIERLNPALNAFITVTPSPRNRRCGLKAHQKHPQVRARKTLALLNHLPAQ